MQLFFSSENTVFSVDLTSQSFDDKSGQKYVAEVVELALFPLFDLGLKNTFYVFLAE